MSLTTPAVTQGMKSAERAGMATIAEKLAALEKMSTRDLQAKFLEVFGYPTRTNNKVQLRKRVAWQIQALAEGGLSARALARIEELAPLAPARWNRPAEKKGAASTATPPNPMPGTAPARPRDLRLPAVGTVLEREHGGRVHHVTVGETDFEYEAQRFRSLSAIARKITGTAWNGFGFFGLAAPEAVATATASAE